MNYDRDKFKINQKRVHVCEFCGNRHAVSHERGRCSCCGKKAKNKKTYSIKKKLEYDLIIIGGGLTGLFAAARAAELGVEKIGLFE